MYQRCYRSDSAKIKIWKISVLDRNTLVMLIDYFDPTQHVTPTQTFHQFALLY